jgi:four helix bundle protein
MSGYAKRFRDLEVYQEAMTASRRIFEVTKTLPREEAFALTGQLRRASRSIGAQIAEAWGKRRYERHFISKLTDADAEQLETQHWVAVAADCGYLSTVTASELLEHLASIGRMLNSMIGKAHRFCGKSTN